MALNFKFAELCVKVGPTGIQTTRSRVACFYHGVGSGQQALTRVKKSKFESRKRNLKF